MYRIGQGYDVHRLTPDRKLILGGVRIPFDAGLEGHSDADVLVHAVCDALLGAAALGDLGKHFPDTDPAYRGADSIQLLRECVRLLENEGYKTVNVDATVIAQRPKISPYTDEMREKLSRALAIDKKYVSVKATTEEGLGFTGQGLGIAAQAVVLIEEK